MKISWTIAAMTLFFVASSQGCVPRYRPPRPDEPHAILKLRRLHEAQEGPILGESATLDGHVAYSHTSDEAPRMVPRVDAILVHPEPATLALGSEFYHYEMRTVQEHYYDRVPYSDSESYSCGSFDHPRTCYRTVTRYRSESRTRWVTKQVPVTDGQCRRQIGLAPQEGHVYLVQYTYQQSGVCQLSCFEQVPMSDGQIQMHPCRAQWPPPRN